MLKKDYNLEWDKFYEGLDNNQETLDKADSMWQTSDYYTDMVIIDIFGRSLDMSFEEIKTIFQYDGPSGPGWGVRQWVSRDWYADLTPTLGFSNPWPVPGEEIDLIANIYNNGQTDANDVPVAFYNGAVLIDSQRVSVPADSVAYAITTFSAPEGSYTITVKVDEDNIKMESDETNNDDSALLTVYADTDADGIADVIDNCPNHHNPGQEDSNGDDVGDACCCAGTMGNVDCEGIIDIGDVTNMIQNLFITLNDPCCEAEADIDLSGLVDIGDLTALISSLFITLNPLAACP